MLHQPAFTLPKLTGDTYKKMALIDRSEGNHDNVVLYSITEGKKITIVNFPKESGLTIRSMSSFNREE